MATIEWSDFERVELRAGTILAAEPNGVTALGAVLLMAFARVYVGVHWPADVTAGLAVGAIVTLTLGIGAVPLLRRGAERLLGTRLRPVLQVNGAGKSSKRSPDAELVPEPAGV
ncbi:MAG TPA: phosphatase PAP2 family protein [Mycobacteriales bacterium]|nr:phosphatase PAP2 family protein [Mycobacteriales bacterium]